MSCESLAQLSQIGSWTLEVDTFDRVFGIDNLKIADLEVCQQT